VGKRGDDSWKFTTTESYGAGLDVSWEANLFGKTTREIEAALADYQAALEDLRDVMVSLTAETATAYVRLRTFQKRLATARENLRLQTETLELTKIKYQTGLAGALDVEQAAYSLESTRAQIPDLEAGLEETKNRLAVLLGSWPGELDKELSAEGKIPEGALETAIGLPADLLRRRPDIRAAERRLASQTAQIGVAQSELYPKLKLSGSLGLSAVTLSGLFSPAAMAAALGAGFSWKIFNLEEVRANIEIQSALQEEALLEYEATLRTAMEEVENALTDLINEARKQEALTKGVQAAREAARLALQEYQSGLADFQNVLSTQQSLISFNDKLDQSRGQATLNLITIYKALGGGWSSQGPAGVSTATTKPESTGSRNRK
jgi:NodT family efflux transporter outer membrane factor (OMF) lipoprotein